MSIKTVTPSAVAAVVEITDGQIDKAGELFRSILKRYRAELPTEAVQQVLGSNEVWPELLTVFRRRVDALSKMIVRRVKVDRTRTYQQAIDATGRTQYINADVLATMPKGEGEEKDVFFFDLDYDPSAKQLAEEYELRGLVSDPIAQAAVNEADPKFADDRPNGCQWNLQENGTASFATFRRWYDGGRSVDVDRGDYLWFRCYRFGGVCK
ncbi:MAG TPA: hypothetical protein VJH67_03130 [Candidatus Paceibacterota bacterium]